MKFWTFSFLSFSLLYFFFLFILLFGVFSIFGIMLFSPGFYHLGLCLTIVDPQAKSTNMPCSNSKYLEIVKQNIKLSLFLTSIFSLVMPLEVKFKCKITCVLESHAREQKAQGKAVRFWPWIILFPPIPVPSTRQGTSWTQIQTCQTTVGLHRPTQH